LSSSYLSLLQASSFTCHHFKILWKTVAGYKGIQRSTVVQKFRQLKAEFGYAYAETDMCTL
jgi:hypothetical protein